MNTLYASSKVIGLATAEAQRFTVQKQFDCSTYSEPVDLPSERTYLYVIAINGKIVAAGNFELFAEYNTVTSYSLSDITDGDLRILNNNYEMQYPSLNLSRDIKQNIWIRSILAIVADGVS